MLIRHEIDDGEDVDLAKYDGKVVMIVTSRASAATPGSDERLQRTRQTRYGERGFAVLGFPAIGSFA